MRRLALDVRAEERRSRRNRHSNRSKRVRGEINEAVVVIRADDDVVTMVSKGVMSARRMAEAEFEGVEFVSADVGVAGEEPLEHEGRAVRVLERLWPFMAAGMLRRLRARGIVVVMVG